MRQRASRPRKSRRKAVPVIPPLPKGQGVKLAGSTGRKRRAKPLPPLLAIMLGLPPDGPVGREPAQSPGGQ
jgi:hypothetical protein